MDIWPRAKKDQDANIESSATDTVDEGVAEARSKLEQSQYGNAPLGVETFVDYLRKED